MQSSSVLGSRRTCALALTAILAALGACSTPPQAPTVDDSHKRPVNDPAAIALQSCRSELSASKIVLTEALATRPYDTPVRLKAVAGEAAASSSRPLTEVEQVIKPEPNTVFIVHFELGAYDFDLPTSQRQQFIELVRHAKYIVVRGRTDAQADTQLQTVLAKRRAQAAFDYLTTTARFPAEAIRMTWQGAGDQAVAGDAPAQRLANRRVEIEMYPTPPHIETALR